MYRITWKLYALVLLATLVSKGVCAGLMFGIKFLIWAAVIRGVLWILGIK